MSSWFQKGNARRFYRIDMPAKLFIVPKTAIQGAEIYATGADYFPPSIRAKIEHYKTDTCAWIDQIQEQKELITTLFYEIIDYIEFFGETVKKISLGQNPKNNLDDWIKIKSHQVGFTNVESIKDSAPKTYKYFKLIEEKCLTFFNHVIYTLSSSTPRHFAVDTDFPSSFKIDDILEQFKDEKFSRIALIQALKQLGQLITAYTDIFQNIINDNHLKPLPQAWQLISANISVSGLAVQLEKSFKSYDKVDIYFYFSAKGTLFHFDGSIVDIRSLNMPYKERVAINFDFPDGKIQYQLQSQIQKYEIKDCLDLVL